MGNVEREMVMQAVVLAGGQSRRMGTNKAFLPVNGKPMIENVIEVCEAITNNVVVISNELSSYKYLKHPILSDRYPQMGPLAGLETAMHYAQNSDWFLIAPCDSPFLSSKVYEDLMNKREKCDIVLPTFQSKIHPLHGIYHKTCLGTIKSLLEEGSLRMSDLYSKHNTKYVEEYDESISFQMLNKHFINLNDMGEYEKWVNP